VCFPDGRDCGECACRTCYPSGRDCRDAQCDVCHPHADDCAEPQCYRCERANRPLEYSYKPAPLFHEWDGTRETTHNRAAPGVAYFGIEIEAEAEESPIGIPYTIRNNKRLEGSRYYYKHDGSVGNGFETVSHPASFRAWCERGPTMQWCETMRRSGYRSYQTDSCGHHVHVSRTALGSPALARLLLFFAQNARTIAKWSRRKSRLLSQWARIETDTDSNIILEKVNDNGRGDRRVAINMQNERTIEFRLFRGTLLSRSILANIGLVELLVGFVNRPEMNDSLPSFFDYANAQRLDPSRTVAERAVLSYVAQFIGATTVMQPETTIVVSPEDS
jgi:hypothetical protein